MRVGGWAEGEIYATNGHQAQQALGGRVCDVVAAAVQALAARGWQQGWESVLHAPVHRQSGWKSLKSSRNNEGSFTRSAAARRCLLQQLLSSPADAPTVTAPSKSQQVLTLARSQLIGVCIGHKDVLRDGQALGT